MYLHYAKAGETLETITEGFVGSPKLAWQLSAVNPHLPLRAGLHGGTPVRIPWYRLADPAVFRRAGTVGQTDVSPEGRAPGPDEEQEGYGTRVKVPGWDDSKANKTCYAGSPITDWKPYVYVVQPGERPSDITIRWGIETGPPSYKWFELRRANADDVFRTDGYGACVWANWYAGKKLRIPASWPDNAAVQACCTQPYAQGGTTDPEKENKGLQGVVYGEESGGTPGWLIGGLAAVAGVAGAILLGASRKRRG